MSGQGMSAAEASDQAVVIRAAAPKIVVRPALVRCQGGESYTGWQVWEGRRLVARHDIRERALTEARNLAAPKMHMATLLGLLEALEEAALAPLPATAAAGDKPSGAEMTKAAAIIVRFLKHRARHYAAADKNGLAMVFGLLADDVEKAAATVQRGGRVPR